MKKNLGAKDILFPTPVLIVGAYDKDGTPNAMNVAWGGLCSSKPPAIAISIRTERRTYLNILEKNAFTVNIASEAVMAEADYFGVVSGNQVKKFDHIDLSAVKANYVDAPYIAELPLALECKVMQVIKVGQHMHVIGEIVNVIADETVLDEKGRVDVVKLKAIGYDPAGNHYIATSEIVGDAFSVGLPLAEKAKNDI